MLLFWVLLKPATREPPVRKGPRRVSVPGFERLSDPSVGLRRGEEAAALQRSSCCVNGAVVFGVLLKLAA